MMKRLQGRCGIGALVWMRGIVLAVAASLAAGAGMAQSVRLVPTVERFAGTGTPQDSGPASATVLNHPTYVTADLSGNVYIADSANNCVRRADNTSPHNMTVAAGQPVGGGSDTCQNPASVTAADPATGVLTPSGVAADSIGNLFIADTGHNCIRRLAAGDTGGTADLFAVVGTCGSSTTASATPAPSALALDARGNLYIAINDTADGIYQVLRSNAPAYGSVCVMSGATSTNAPTYCPGIASAPVLNAPTGLTIDPLGYLYIADSGNACVRRIVGASASTAVGQCSNDSTGSPATALQKPVSVASDAAGHLYITDTTAAQVFELVGGQLTAVAGNGTTAPYNGTTQDGQAAATIPLNEAAGLATDRAGNVYLAETGNNIVRLLTEGLNFPSTVVGGKSQLQFLRFVISSAVNLNVTVGSDYQALGGSTCGGSHPAPTPGTPETCFMSFNFAPTLPGLRTSALTLADTSTSPATLYTVGLTGVGQSAEAIFAPGTINTLTASLASPSAVAIDSAGDVYFAESGNGSISVLPAGSGTPTQLIAPGGSIATPTALTLDAAGNLYIADSASNAIFRYDVNGNLTTVTSGLDHPVALAIDQLGDLYVAEDGASTVGVLEIYAGGQQSIIAGQGTLQQDGILATNAKFVHPSALYLDPTGNLYVGDRGAYRVYQIDPSGFIHYFAGNGTPNDAPNPKARIDFGLAGIAGISADPAGDIFIADATNNRLVLVFSGLAANPEAEVIAGDGTAGNTGDGKPANQAELNNPMAVAVDGSAEVFLADTGNGSLRKITYTQPTLDFGTVKLGQTAGPLSTTLWNAGNLQLIPVFPTWIDGGDLVGFALDTTDSNCSGISPAGSTCDFFYTFTPKAPGSYVKHSGLADSSADPTQTITLIATVPPPPVATITASPVTVVYGDPYTLAATITGNQGAGNEPTGTATFSIGSSTLCTQPLPSTGAVSCSPSPTLEDVGTYTVTISYLGDTNYPASQTTIKLIVTPRPVTITADDKTRPVNTANPPLTGTVVNVVPGQSIVATYSTTAVTSSPAGTYPITPAYTFGPGTKASNYTVTVVNGTLTITADSSGGGNPPGGGGGDPPPGGGTGGSFTLATNPPEQEIDHNGTVNYVVTLGSTGGFTGPVTLACSGLPAGASCAFAPASVTLAAGASGTSTMTITAAADHTNVPIASNMRNMPPQPGSGSSPLLAWTMLPLGVLFGVRRRRQLFLLLAPFALLIAALGATGCGISNNYKIYTVTVSGTASNGSATITQSSTVDFVLAR